MKLNNVDKKRLFLQQYNNCDIISMNNGKRGKSNVVINMQCLSEDNDIRIILKSLSNLSRKDYEIICYNTYVDTMSVKDYFKQSFNYLLEKDDLEIQILIDKFVIKILSHYQTEKAYMYETDILFILLRDMGYLVPTLGMDVDEIIELGWVVIED